ncbi:MAG TPA: hypothetical protein DCR97_06970 [Deltaproteobacteria bacterium]|nr:hypothetical protein [Deltaproteobacteria bacterium]
MVKKGFLPDAAALLRIHSQVLRYVLIRLALLSKPYHLILERLLDFLLQIATIDLFCERILPYREMICSI